MFSILWLQYKIFNSIHLLGPTIYFLSSLKIKLASSVISLQGQTTHIYEYICTDEDHRRLSAEMLAASTRQSLEVYLQFICKDLFYETGEHMSTILALPKNSLVPCDHRSSP